MKAWRSTDQLKTFRGNGHVRRAGRPHATTRARRGGLPASLSTAPSCRLADGTWLATLEGSMESDTLKPADHQSKIETPFKQRTIVVSSSDEGHARGNMSRRWPIRGPTIRWAKGSSNRPSCNSTTADCCHACAPATIIPSIVPGVPTRARRGPRRSIRASSAAATRACSGCTTARILLSYGKRFPEGWSQAGPELRSGTLEVSRRRSAQTGDQRRRNRNHLGRNDRRPTHRHQLLQHLRGRAQSDFLSGRWLVFRVTIEAETGLRKGGDCPNFRVSENGTVPFDAARVAPIAWLSGCRRHKRASHRVKSLLRLRRPDRQAIGATPRGTKTRRSLLP